MIQALRKLFQQDLVLRVIKRDWLTLIAGLIAFAHWCWVIHLGNNPNELALRAAATSLLGIPLAIGAQRSIPQRLLPVAGVFIALALGVYYYLQALGGDAQFLLSFAYAFFGVHLFVAIASWIKSRVSLLKLWQYNWYALTRIIYGGICAGVFFVGVSVALYGIKVLLNVNVEASWYFYTLAFSAILMSTWLVLIAFDSLPEVMESKEIPRELNLLVKAIFTPLSCIYLLLIFAYLLKMAFLQEWPAGGIGWPVSGLALMVFLSYLIHKPLETEARSQTLFANFWRYSFAFLILPIVLLLWALSLRISQYGWTEIRYIAVLLSLWALGMSIYYIKPQKRGIVAIPLSLLILTGLTWVGPLSPRSVATTSMKNYYAELLKKYGVTIGESGYEYASPVSNEVIREFHSRAAELCQRLTVGEFYEVTRFPKNLNDHRASENCFERRYASEAPLTLVTAFIGAIDGDSVRPQVETRKIHVKMTALDKLPPNSWYVFFDSAQPSVGLGDQDRLSIERDPGGIVWHHETEEIKLSPAEILAGAKNEVYILKAKDGAQLRIQLLYGESFDLARGYPFGGWIVLASLLNSPQ